MESIVISIDDEEALSLRDLPLESQFQPRNEENSDTQAIKSDEDFNFVSLANSFSKDSQMCSADQLFFKGQIVPLCVLSGSKVHGSSSRFTNATISNTNSFTDSNTNSKAMNFRNKFDTDPSQPIKVRIRNRTSSVWEFFRFGLVRAPELELHDLKVRKSCVGRNSKVVNNNNGDKRIMGRYSGCKCSVNVVETVPVNNILFIKSDKKNEKKKAILLEKKKVQLELKKMKEKEKKVKIKREGKQAFFGH